MSEENESDWYGAGDNLGNLKGKTIVEVGIAPSGEYISFRTTEKLFVYQVEAGCCSESWITDLMGLEFLLGEEVLEVVHKELGNHEGTRQEVDKLYSIDLRTSKGVATIDFRNSSNGYYGASLHWMTYSSDALPVITKDWSYE